MRTVQDIKNEVIDYIRNSGESVKDYNICAIVDTLLEQRWDGNADMLELVVFQGRKD